MGVEVVGVVMCKHNTNEVLAVHYRDCLYWRVSSGKCTSSLIADLS